MGPVGFTVCDMLLKHQHISSGLHTCAVLVTDLLDMITSRLATCLALLHSCDDGMFPAYCT